MYSKLVVRTGFLLVLLAFVLLVLPTSGNTGAPSGSWWNADWQYRRQLSVSPSAPTPQTQAIPRFQALFEGESIRIRPVVEANPDAYTYTLITAPGSSDWDAASSTWTWTTTYLDVGAHQVTFRATDKSNPGNTVELTTQINVYPNMTPPRWQKHDPTGDRYADAVMVAEPALYPWESDTVRDPTIAVYAETGLPYKNASGEYMMFYTGGSSTGAAGYTYQTGLATSTDLINWTKHPNNPVLGHGASGAWDHEKVVPGSVLVMSDGTFRMYYCATGGGTWGTNYRIGMATSTDGVLWERYSANPILDVGPYEQNMVLPYAVKIGPTDWIMMFEASGVTGFGSFICGLAISTDDGLTWTKPSADEYYALLPSASQWDRGSVANPKPMKLGENMFFLGYNGAVSSDYKLGIAVSFDGIHWYKYSGNPILSGDGDGVGDGYRIEGIQWLKDQFGHDHMDMIYFGGDAGGPHSFRIVLATMDIPEPTPPTDPTYLTKGTIFEDFSSPQSIVNNVIAASGEITLPAGYTVNLTLDTNVLVSAGKMRSDGDDLRIAYWDGTAWLELDRLVEEMTTDHTRIWFKTQAVIDGIDDNYYLHHGNPSAESPPEDWANVYKVGDNFDDGTLTDTLTPSWAGAATVAETGGELVIDMGTNSGDAAIVSTPIDASKRFVLRHKVMYIGSTGTVDDLNIAAIVQNATQPVVTVNMTFNPTFRVYFYQDRTGSFIMQYIDSSRIAHRWNGSSWQTSSPAPWAYNGSIGTYYIAEIVSDGNQFYQVLRDGNGNVLTQTTPVLWDQVLDDGNPLWLVWGEPYTSHYWLDAKSDFFYLRDYVYPEPAVLVGEEDTLNTAPVAVADSYGTNEDALLSIPAPGVLANDTDADTNPLTAILVTGPSYAKSFTLNSNGSFAYAPNDNYYGPDSFSYKANDGSADSEPTTVTITITPVNDAPDAIDDTATVNEDSSMVIAVLANDTDVDGDLLSATSVSAPANGTAAINDGATITYTPNPNFCGLDSFTYSISDGNGGGDTATVTITVYCVNDPPVAVDDSYSTDEDTTLVVAVPGVLGNDSDIEGNTLTAVLVSAPTHGSSFALDSDGSFSYTPVLNFNGSDSFTYNVNDGLADSNTVTVTITVNAVNDAPRVSVSPTTQTVQYSDGIAPITITATDVDSFPLTATPSGLPPDVILTGSCTSDGTEGASCTWTIQGIADVPEGNYPVTITVSDGGVEGSVTENITITVIPEDAGVAFHEDNPVAVKVARGGGTAPSFDLYVDVFEIYPEPYGSPANSGDIRNAHLQVSLVPVGPGGGSGPITCTPYAVEEPTNYGRLTFVCNIPAGLAVNTYSLIAELVGGYYAGSAEDVLVVYDPSLGFVTGGGWFYWPGTEEGQVGNPDYYPGDKTNFGFTMRYNRRGTNVQGRLLLIRHLPDGMVLDCGGSPIYNMIYGVKSNALYGLALGQTGTYGRASFSGKATYLDPCMPKPEGNHEFIVYVEDLNEPGKGVDRFWIEVKDKDGNVITEMSMPLPAGHNAEEIQGGNIVVPHR